MTFTCKVCDVRVDIFRKDAWKAAPHPRCPFCAALMQKMRAEDYE